MSPSANFTPFLAAMAAEVVFMVVFPLVLAVIARRRLGVGWRYFWYGALVFLLSQVLTRVPAVQVAQAALLPWLRESVALQWAWLLILALTAGLFEEVGRYIGYRVLMRREAKTWRKVVFFGIGHGALESALLIAGLTLATLVGIAALASGGLEALPAEQRTVAAQQLTAVAAQPVWVPLLGAWERVPAMAVHVAFSVLVLQVFRRHSLVWLWLAVLGHALVNFLAGALPLLLGPGFETTLVAEVIITALGVLALWITWRLRDDAHPVAAEPVSTVPSDAGPAAAEQPSR